MLITRSSVYIVALATSFILSACSNSDKAEETIETRDSISQAVLETKLNAQNVFNSIPARREIMKLVDENKVEYNAELLNDPRKVDKYTFESAKAANLGIYGSDLTIASAFEQTQESMIFLECVNVLAGELGVNGAFDQHIFDRMEVNKSNNDSTLEIITGAFKAADEILKNNNRPATSAIVLSGAWIEGLYVSAKITEALNTDGLAQSILKQKESLKNLIILLESLKLDDSSSFILTELKSLQESFREAQGRKAKGFELIKDITVKITALRTKITSGA